MEPAWLLDSVVLAIHERLLSELGGASGIRDAALLDSALARPPQLLAYGDPDIFEMAAASASGIVLNHPFVDGSKRTVFMCAYVFLMRNGFQLMAPEVDAAQAVIDLAAGDLAEDAFVNWLRGACEPL
jgi:death-on-curing protein